MSIHYRPASSGGWVALCAGSRALLIGGTLDDSLSSRLSVALADADSFTSTLAVLVRDGLTAIPPFALVDLSAAAARVIVRGGVTVTITGPSGPEVIDAEGVSTWTERVIVGASGLAVEVRAAVAVEAVGFLSLESGAAWVAGLEISDFAPATPATVTTAVASAPPAVIPPTPKSVSTVPAAVVPVEIDPEATMTEFPKAEPSQPSPDGYDYLFGDTVYRDVADAAVEEPSGEPTPEPDVEPEVKPDAGDHDGMTVLTSDIAKLRPFRRAKRAPAAEAAPGPAIVLTLASGAKEALTQPILVGRAPSIGKLTDGVIPRLLTVGTVDQDISRTHARIALEGGTVVVTDLHSRNGTMVVLPGKAPQKLRAGEPTSIIVGTVIDFGGGVSLTVNEEANGN